jgi:glycerol kinase
MATDSGLEIKELRVDGGATANDTLMQIQADIMNLDVVRPKVLETTALGAAYFAGLAIGFWSGIDEIQRQWAEDQTFKPKKDMTIELKTWKKAVERSKNWMEE